MPFEPPFLEPMCRLNLNQMDKLLGLVLRPVWMRADRLADWCTDRPSWRRPCEML